MTLAPTGLPPDLPADGLVPDWPAIAGVRACLSTRAGGVSAPPYAQLNLGDHVGDQPEAVAENRRRFAAGLAAVAPPGGRATAPRPVFLKQVHGRYCVTLDAQTPDGAEADACVTDQPGLACTILVADCLPVLLSNGAGTVVGAAHAGWRGLCEGVLEQTIMRFRALAGVNANQLAINNIANDVADDAADDIRAWLGPCIGPTAFEVGAEVRAAFVARSPQAAQHFAPQAGGKFLASLPALARQRLAALGITQVGGNDGSPAWCTVGNPSRFFSHRRDRVSGRMAACIWRV